MSKKYRSYLSNPLNLIRKQELYLLKASERIFLIKLSVLIFVISYRGGR